MFNFQGNIPDLERRPQHSFRMENYKQTEKAGKEEEKLHLPLKAALAIL